MILVLNTGSSSVKIALFDSNLAKVLSGQISGIGANGDLRLGQRRRPVQTENHAHAIDLMLSELAAEGYALQTFKAAAHRVVHGGDQSAPVRLFPASRAAIADAVALAPLHNPPALAGIDALSARAPGLPQYASFDTAFHADQPALASTYALPHDIRSKGVRRYGFHGLSYASLVGNFGPALPERLIAFHLGAGVSLCAILDGRSVATSMGYSPLSGPPMATRAGDIDAGAVLQMAAEYGIGETHSILNHRSGLLGLSGTSADMQALLKDGSAQAVFAVEHFCYWVARQAGSLITALGGVDAFAFTGGIGENAGEVRDRILDHLAFLGPKPVHIIKAQEEHQIARDTQLLIRSGK